MADKKEFNNLREDTKKELIELMIKDNYVPNLKEESIGKETIRKNIKKDKIDTGKSKDFHGLSEETQKEIIELMEKERKYNSEKESGKTEDSKNPSVLEALTENKFDGLRIMKINEFVSQEEAKMRKLMSEEETRQAQQEREFTDVKFVRDLVEKKDLGGTVSNEKMHSQSVAVEKTYQKYGLKENIMTELKDKEQQYTKKQLEEQEKILRDVANLLSGRE